MTGSRIYCLIYLRVAYIIFVYNSVCLLTFVCHFRCLFVLFVIVCFVFLLQTDPSYVGDKKELYSLFSVDTVQHELVSGLNNILYKGLQQARSEAGGVDPSWYKVWVTTKNITADGIPQIHVGRGVEYNDEGAFLGSVGPSGAGPLYNSFAC